MEASQPQVKSSSANSELVYRCFRALPVIISWADKHNYRAVPVKTVTHCISFRQTISDILQIFHIMWRFQDGRHLGMGYVLARVLGDTKGIRELSGYIGLEKIPC